MNPCTVILINLNSRVFILQQWWPKRRKRLRRPSSQLHLRRNNSIKCISHITPTVMGLGAQVPREVKGDRNIHTGGEGRGGGGGRGYYSDRGHGNHHSNKCV